MGPEVPKVKIHKNIMIDKSSDTVDSLLILEIHVERSESENNRKACPCLWSITSSY